MNQLEEKLTELRNELQVIGAKQRETDELMLDLNHELDRYNAIVKENQGKIKHFNNEVCLNMQHTTYMYRVILSIAIIMRQYPD